MHLPKPTRNAPLPPAFLPVSITALVYLILLVFILNAFGFDLTRFVMAGDKYVDAAQADPGLYIEKNATGYDGQFYYRLAIQPFSSAERAAGVAFDAPHYRSQRIVYPLLAHLLALGQPAWVPPALLVINLLALCGIAFLGSRLAQQQGRSPVWGAAFALYFGFFMSFVRDLGEILAVFFLLAGLLLARRKPVAAALLLTLAVLTKETALIFTLAVLAAAFLERWKRWPVFLLPALTYAVWQGVLTLRFGSITGDVANHIGLPFSGLWIFWQYAINSGDTYNLVILALIALFSLAALLGVLLGHAPLALKLAFLGYFALAAFLTNAVWFDQWSFMRALSEFYISGLAVCLGIRKNSLVLWPRQRQYTSEPSD